MNLFDAPGEKQSNDTHLTSMEPFDFDQSADLFARAHRAQHVKYYKFPTAAQAIRFAIEQLPQNLRGGLVMEIDEVRYRAPEILTLYQRADFPLARQT